MTRLAIVSSHPIQYNAPLFKKLAACKGIVLKVFYTWEQSSTGAKYDPGFGKQIAWDVPLLEGYDYCFVKNTAAEPGTHHFKGIINPTLNREIDEWKADAVLVYGWSFSGHLKCIRYFHQKIPVLFRGDSTLLDEKPGFKRLLRKLFLRWVYSHIDYALYVGTNNKAYFLQHGLQDDQLIFCPHAVDNDRFSGDNENNEAAVRAERTKLGFDADDLVLLFAGKLEPKKNPLFLVELARHVPAKNFKVLFAGNGSLEKQLKENAAADKRIQFIDFCNQSKMPLLYKTADVFILPSRGPGETWGLAANEAMAGGLAVMLSDKTGGAADLVEEGVNGIVFGVNDVKKCTDFLVEMLANKERLAAMKAASKQIITRFSYDQTVQSLENLLQEIEKKVTPHA